MKTKFTPFAPPVDPRYPEANKVFQAAAGEAAHTPTPWHIESAQIFSRGNESIICDPWSGCANIIQGARQRLLPIDEREANAAFIVRACNEYDHLKDVEKRHEVALQMLKERSEREAALVANLQALAATARTFRNVPKDEQEWTPIDEETLDRAFALLSTLNT